MFKYYKKIKEITQTVIYALVIVSMMFQSLPVQASAPATVVASIPQAPLRSNALTTGLYGYWKLDEATGTIRYDSTSYGNHINGVYTALRNTSGKITYAAELTGSSSYRLSEADNANLSVPNTSFSGSAWVYPHSYTDARFITKNSGYTGSTSREYDLKTDASGYLSFVVGTSSTAATTYTSNMLVPLNTWSLVGWSFDINADTIVLYRINSTSNNSQSFTSTLTPRDGIAPFYIGGYRNDSGFYIYDGLIDEVGFWKRALTANEFALLYHGGAGCTYPFTGCEPTFTLSGNGLPGAAYVATATPTVTASATGGLAHVYCKTSDEGSYYDGGTSSCTRSTINEYVTFSYYAVDNYGYTSDVYTTGTLMVDRTPPTMYAQSAYTNGGLWYDPSIVTVYPDSFDAKSGIASHFVSKDLGATWQSSISLTATTSLYCRAVDNVGNVSQGACYTRPNTVYTYYIDDTNPTLSFLVDGAAYSGALLPNTTHTVAANSSDSQSGIAGGTNLVSKDGGATWASSVSISAPTTIWCKASDNASPLAHSINQSCGTVNISNTVLNFNVNGNPNNSPYAYGTALTITAASTDPDGISDVNNKISVDGGLTWVDKTSSASITHTETIWCKATDNATPTPNTVSGVCGKVDVRFNEEYKYNATTGNLEKKGEPGISTSYTYPTPTQQNPNPQRPHAALNNGIDSTLPDGVSVAYDAAGNAITRTNKGVTTSFVYDAAGQLVSASNTSTTYKVIYDGKGNKVATVLNNTATIIVEGAYEWKSSSEWKKYYSVNGSAVAVRDQNGIQYMFGNNVGSTNGWATSDGATFGSQRYLPWGEAGTSSGSAAITDRKYTGQKELASLGIYDYNARNYDPMLGRFLQADSIIPNANDPISYDRYAYVGNSPIMKNDPSGHCPECLFVAAMTVGGAFLGGLAYEGKRVLSHEAWNSSVPQKQVKAVLDGAAAAGSLAVLILEGKAGVDSVKTAFDMEYAEVESMLSGDVAFAASEGAANSASPVVIARANIGEEGSTAKHLGDMAARAEDYALAYPEKLRANGIYDSMDFVRGAYDHDIFKGTDGAISDFDSPLKLDQMSLGQQASLKNNQAIHTIRGFQMLVAEGETNPTVLNMTLLHQERYDGTGYPLKLSGKEIPFEARLCQVLDVCSAIRINRGFNGGAKSWTTTFEIMDKTPNQFDPDIFSDVKNLYK